MNVRSRFFVPTLAPLALLLFTASCAKDEPPQPAPEGNVPAASAAPSADVRADARLDIAPKLGGKVFLVGAHACELAVYADGRVDGLVFDAKGNGVEPERVSEFTATFSAEADVRPRVELLWDAAAKRFSGRAELETSLSARPVDVTLQVDGKAQTGVLASYTLVPVASLEAKADVVGDATLTAPKLPAPKASAKLRAGAKAVADARALADAKVTAPKLKAPNAAASIRAKADAKVVAPKPKVAVAAKASAGTEKKKTGAGVKAKASFGFGN